MNKKIDKYLLDRFSNVFAQKLWGDNESLSGPGSRNDSPLVVTAISAIEFVIENYNVHSISDIPCGDFNWFKAISEKYSSIDYVGFDIVAALVENNRARYPRMKFEQFDIVSDIPPKSDLIFSKELLIHLTNNDIKAAISNMKTSGSQYFLASNSFGVENIEISENAFGYGRPIDLCRSPFSLPAPLWNNAFYALWRFSDIIDQAHG